jgi:uncharacterized membrane-anchored protein YhcB (DUF1043 family)
LSDTIAEAVTERVQGERPGRWKAIVAAVAAGCAIGLLVYRLLRSEPDDEDEAE